MQLHCFVASQVCARPAGECARASRGAHQYGVLGGGRERERTVDFVAHHAKGGWAAIRGGDRRKCFSADSRIAGWGEVGDRKKLSEVDVLVGKRSTQHVV